MTVENCVGSIATKPPAELPGFFSTFVSDDEILFNSNGYWRHTSVIVGCNVLVTHITKKKKKNLSVKLNQPFHAIRSDKPGNRDDYNKWLSSHKNAIEEVQKGQQSCK